VLDNVVHTGGFDTLDQVLARVPAGSGGVLFLPWLRGSMAPANDSDMRGGYVNMSLDTGRDELVRATCEGVAHNLAWLLPHAEALTGERVEEIVFVGGAARSPGWAQIVADVLDRPVLVPDRPEVAIARATALLALHRHGVLARDDLSRLASSGVALHPIAAHHDVYARHQPQFEAVFEALRPISAALNAG
jgi:xylulokinase